MEEMSLLMRWSFFANEELWSAFDLIHRSGESTFSRTLAARLTLVLILACWTLTTVSWV